MRGQLLRRWAGVLPVCVLLTACSTMEPLRAVFSSSKDREASQRAAEATVYQSGAETRIRYLEREVERLQADLQQAEAAMVAIESGLRGRHGRADAVSELAEARIAVERAQRGAPWRRAQLAEARSKLEEAESQFQAGHSGSAIFFASRARRIAETLQEEAARVAGAGDAHFVDRRRVNLRADPSTRAAVVLILDRDTPVFPERARGEWVLVRTTEGPVGWVHRNLLRK